MNQAPDGPDRQPWLSAEQQVVWRQWLAVNAQLPAALNRQLQGDATLSLQDFDVLVQLTDTEEGRVRVSALAAALQWERSRLSHHVKRMQTRGLIVREACDDDGRGAFIAITEAGRRAIVGAAPAHVRTVQRLVFDALSPDEVAALGAVTRKILSRLTSEPVG